MQVVPGFAELLLRRLDLLQGREHAANAAELPPLCGELLLLALASLFQAGKALAV
jgi:hypothetical protein